MRKSLASKRDAVLFEQAAQKIEALSDLAQANYLDLCFYDESHFGLVPVVPYAWQQKGAGKLFQRLNCRVVEVSIST